MDIRDQIDVYLNTAFKQSIEQTPYSGHSLVKLAEWDRVNGFVKKESVSYVKDTIDIAVPCPVIAIVDEKIREKNLTLTIIGNVAEYDQDIEFNQLGKTIIKKQYKTSTTTSNGTLEIPRFTRPNATFLVASLGNKIFEITNITSNLPLTTAGGKVSFYALASEGSKVLYYLGMYRIHNMIKQIVNSIWISPTECNTCKGTGLLNGIQCPQCKGYKYSGENASRGIAIAKGYDVGISREKFSSYPLSDAQWNKVWKFINQAWTQKWWVTPTVSEIKRLFAHFYNVSEGEIIITERYHFSMPHWDISIPIEGSLGSPFDSGDIDLAKFIARSVTPAGVNVFIGFYSFEFFGNLDDLSCGCVYHQKGHLMERKILESSTSGYYDNWFSRYRYWNGWCECVDDFEDDLSKWNTSGSVSLQNVNDIGRHWCKLTDSSHIETKTGYAISQPTGTIDIWIHPSQTNLRIGAYLTGVDLWSFYVDFRGSGFYDHNNNLIRPAMFNNDYHLQMSFVADQYLGGQLGYVDDIRINLESVETGIQFLNSLPSNRPVRIKSSGVGFSFVDNFGADWVGGYSPNGNWQRLYPWGWGPNHLDCLSGVADLYESYFRNDKFFNINVSGVC